MRILIAEDDRVSRTLLLRSLERLGHDCVATEDGAAAWDAYQAGDFDVVISDWLMPGMDGLELCRRVRITTDSHYTYFIILTALDSRENFVIGMEAGADDYLTKPLDRDQLKAKLIAAHRLMTLHRRLAAQNNELEALNKQLYEEGRVDSLTRVGNRLRMTEELEAAHDRVRRYGHRYCIALCDVDFFKKYNDTCGHQAGDEALRAVGRMLKEQSRTGDSVYRYGGEEFLVLLPEQSIENAELAMERMRHALEALEIAHPGKTPPGVVTMSVGIASLLPDDGKSVEELLKEADDALYHAKQSGRNRVVSHAQTT